MQISRESMAGLPDILELPDHYPACIATSGCFLSLKSPLHMRDEVLGSLADVPVNIVGGGRCLVVYVHPTVRGQYVPVMMLR